MNKRTEMFTSDNEYIHNDIFTLDQTPCHFNTPFKVFLRSSKTLKTTNTNYLSLYKYS